MQHPNASTGCRHIASPTAGLSNWSAPPRQAPGVSPTPSGSASTAGSCRAQGGAHPACGQPGLTPCMAACWAATHHSVRACWALKLGRHPQGKAHPPQLQGLLGPSAEQVCPPGEMPPVPQQRANARHPTPGIPTGQQQTTRPSTHTSSSHGRASSEPTFLCPCRTSGGPLPRQTPAAGNSWPRQGREAEGQSRQGLGGRAVDSE